MYEYKVAELREKWFGGRQAGGQLEALLNEHGRQGWRAIAITKADIKGRIGPGSTEGLLITFERQVS
jgi:Domain of unknown function (DUF4177)